MIFWVKIIRQLLQLPNLFLLLVIISRQQLRVSAQSKNILILGDSWAFLAKKNLVESLCPGSTVRNIGISGTTAEQWVNNPNLDSDLLPADFDPDYIWVSLGGNDYITKPLQNCIPTGGASQVAGHVQTLIEKLDVKYGSLGTKLLLTGYGVPTSATLALGLCDTVAVWESLSTVYTDFTYSSSTTVIPVTELFGGSVSGGTYISSNTDYYADIIHLNQAGYEVFFKHAPINNFFGGICTGSPPSSPPPPGGGICFSKHSTVQELNKGRIMLKDVELGDKILTASNNYQTVYSFLHKHDHLEASFLQVMTSAVSSSEHKHNGSNISTVQAPLEISGEHFVYKLNPDTTYSAVRADTLRVGDQLLAASDDRIANITDIRKIRRKGIYAPLTVDGTAVVDGIITSNYIGLPGQPINDVYIHVGDHGFPFLKQATAIHMAMGPLRMWCLARPQSRVCLVNDYKKAGMTDYVAWVESVYLWITQQPAFFQWIALVMLLPAGLLCTVVEVLLFNSSSGGRMMIAVSLLAVGRLFTNFPCYSREKVR